jgi:predicted nucleic acid-binding Zn ribbon protein
MQEDLQDPDDSDIEREGEDFASSEPCPSCGKPIYEDTEICPRCGHYISQEDSTSRKPLWIILTAGVCIAVILIVWVLLRM